MILKSAMIPASFLCNLHDLNLDDPFKGFNEKNIQNFKEDVYNLFIFYEFVCFYQCSQNDHNPQILGIIFIFCKSKGFKISTRPM